MPRLVRPAFVLAMLALGGCSSREYRVPLGSMGSLPDYAGYPCELGWFSSDAVELIPMASGTHFRANKLGTSKLSCPKRDLTLVVEELARLELTGPDHVEVNPLIDAEYVLKGYGTSGQALDLDLIFDPDETWTAPASFRLRVPRCGHMAAICSGPIGGKSRRADPQEPGTVVLETTLGNKSTTLTVTVEPKAPSAP